jgi:hypothetical protein
MHGLRGSDVISLTDGCCTDPQNVYSARDIARTGLLMSMTQLVIGSALGFIAAQGVLYGIKHLIGRLQHEEMRKQIRKLSPSLGSTFIDRFAKYAALVGASAAVITLGVWAVRDHLAATSERSAAVANTFDSQTSSPISDPDGSLDQAAGLTPPKGNPPTAAPVDNVDPYTDPDFKVHRQLHHAGTALTLKETLLGRSEAKARADLLRETQQHLHRSQYDCEAADRAGKYLKADLDVWGFAIWQTQYFPMDSYRGATLPQCKDIKNVVDPSSLHLQSTVAHEHP